MHLFEIIEHLKKGNINPQTLVKGREPIDIDFYIA